MMNTTKIYSAAEEQLSESIVGQSDQDVISSILNGAIDEFEIILKRYERYVFAIVIKHVPYETAQEVAHEVFIKIYYGLRSFRGETPFKHFVAAIAVRSCYDYWRQWYKSNEAPMSTLTQEHSNWCDSVIASESLEIFKQSQSSREAKEVLHWALNAMTLEERMVLTLTHLEGLSVKEAAKLLGWSAINVKVRAHRARTKLKKQIIKLINIKDGDMK
ncbi:MAG: RNA polymerase sigma factor [Nitrospirae bacterium]|nr:RNA polymerase sigma factor [Nitrospirota bacterium]